MNAERLNLHQAESGDTAELIDAESFDLAAFFGSTDAAVETGNSASMPSDEQLPAEMPDLLLTLRDDANESIATLTTKITADSFAAGASLTSNVFSALGSLVGSCGLFCAHSLGALGQAGSGLSGVSGLAGGVNMPGFSVDTNGNFHLDGNIDSLSRATGISKGDLLSGRFSADDILTKFFSVFGEGLSLVFGFGVFETIMGCMFDCFLPNSAQAA